MTGVLTGCCGWCEAHARYYREFPIIEIQQTFYDPPPPALAEKWRREAPAGFRFTIKAWQLITHTASSPTWRKLKSPPAPETRAAYGSFRPAPEVRAAFGRTMDFARALAASAIVFQCPASFTASDENIANLRRFFRAADRGGIPFVWEPRGDWPPDVVAGLCRELDLVHAVDPFTTAPVDGRFRYFRLHGRGSYRYRYSDEDLHRLRAMVQGRDACVLFNNTAMRDDARRFQALPCTLTS